MRSTPQINSGSMADIAFLLLVFFLVTTSIDQDFAIKTNIAKPFEVPDSVTLATISIVVNDEGKYMINNKEIQFEQIHERLASSMNTQVAIKNVIVVKSGREVSYENFLAALNESKKAFKTYYNDLAQNKFGIPYYNLSDSLKVRLRVEHPVAIAEDILD